tara:strand:- start:111 stop:965 length:855 start_codon:yes stop_codon:yes gene_type:complete
MHDADMGHPSSTEHSTIQALPFFGGVEMLRARYVTQRFSRHFHEGYAVGYIEQGAMRFRYMGESMVASRGQINLVIPGESHDGHTAEENGWTYRMFYLPPEAVLEAARAVSPKASLPHFRMGVIEDRQLADCICQTHTLLEQDNIASIEKETRLLWLLAHWISRHADQRPHWHNPGNEHKAVNRARDFIQAEYARDTSLTELARQVGLSPFHLVRVFQKQMGVTPHDYLTQVRAERVRERLMGKDRLADIAADCGFSDQAHMSRSFKRHTGVTPGRYRKILQNS